MSDDRPEVPRDQIPTAFTAALRRLTRAIPGGTGAVFCDAEGEAIDFWGALDTFDLKVAGAQLASLHDSFAPKLGPHFGIPLFVHLRGDVTSYLYARLSPDYYVVAVLTPWASWSEALDDIAAALEDLASEAGLG